MVYLYVLYFISALQQTWKSSEQLILDTIFISIYSFLYYKLNHDSILTLVPCIFYK